MIENLIKVLEEKVNLLIKQNASLKSEIERVKKENEELKIEILELRRKAEAVKEAEKTVESLIERVSGLLEN